MTQSKQHTTPDPDAPLTNANASRLIGKDTGITIGLLVVVLGCLGGFVMWTNNDARWKTNKDRDIAEMRIDTAREFEMLRLEQSREFSDIKDQLDTIERTGTGDRVRMSEFRFWCEQFKRMNPEIDMPDIDLVFRAP